MMNILSFLFKAYIVVLLLRWILTRQELTFNFIGRGVAKITDPLLAYKGKPKSETDRFIPLIIVLITLLYGVILRFFMNYEWSFAIIVSFKEMALFLALFFIVCVLLGSMATSAAGTLPLYFYRLGNIWVKPVRKILPLRGNTIIIPAFLLVTLVYLGVNFTMTYVGSVLYYVPVNIGKMIEVSAVTFVMGLNGLLFGLIVVIVIRALLSWVSPDPRNIIVQLIYYITEPILVPMRRIVPPLGIFDLSALVTIVLLSILHGGINRVLDSVINTAELGKYL